MAATVALAAVIGVVRYSACIARIQAWARSLSWWSSVIRRPGVSRMPRSAPSYRESPVFVIRRKKPSFSVSTVRRWVWCRTKEARPSAPRRQTPEGGAAVTMPVVSAVCFITSWPQGSMLAGSDQRAFRPSTSNSKSTSAYSSRWNRNRGASAWAKAARLVMALAPVMRGLSSPR